ncbi:hypothetical protein G7068_11290 [Leucobacter viscericola]|uniref:FAD-dependent urate hydroxylase HpyO/Asp monooxygenase CreE-like FAD/NAD(P)-binding domain-containing protein n=1 Tax=Leucobacter viscericola TaxID=2714935 RepID=A0A6G7XGL8_9MICO|nr:FAD/NAD(P)-binding protein [Leucobacter viscericola]QIK63705.1 hypothetical protein G7068_11290 [Leucobacter viscericola]
MTSKPSRASIAIIGAGPRGTSLIERIGASLTGPTTLDLHVIDEAQSGAGRIWRTDQTRELCMNTLAGAVTLFTEESSSVAGPVLPGPTQYEWCVLVRDTAAVQDPGHARNTLASTPSPAIPQAHTEAFHSHPVRDGLAAEYREELAGILPESHPSRALYGEYLSWCYHRAVAQLPEGVRVIRHRSRAVGIEQASYSGANETVLLADGTSITANSIIIAAGWLPRAETLAERELAASIARAEAFPATAVTTATGHPALTWVRPDSPVDQDLSGITPGSHAIVRGLGMGFFDTMALLTAGRGGEFSEDQTAPGGLLYTPSGQEPILHVTSRRGVPFRAKSLYNSLPPKPAQRFLREVDWEATPRPINFDQQVWPRIVADAFFDYYATLHRVRPEALIASPSQIHDTIRIVLESLLLSAADLTDAPAAFNLALAPFVPNASDRFDLSTEIEPVDGAFARPEDFDAWIRERVEHDLHEAELGVDSPLKAGLWSVSTARAVANRIGTLGGFDAESRRSGFALLHAIGGMVGSGPPAFRNRQLLALAEQGIVRFIGPGAPVTVSEHGFTTASPVVADSEITAPALIDAWMHFHDLAETRDPLAQSLVQAERARAFGVTRRDGGLAPTRAFDVDGETGRLVRADGTLDAAIHVAGIPVDDTLHDTIISPMPGTDPPMLRETDRVARSALGVAGVPLTRSRRSSHSDVTATPAAVPST